MKYFCLLIFIVSSASFGQSMGFTLHGMLGTHPYWVNANGNEIGSINFSFDNNISSTSSSNVDSNTLNVSIISPDEAGSNMDIIVTRPSSCRIGSHSINDNDVHVIKDGSVISSNQTVTFIEGTSSSLKLRFSGNGSYGDKFGAVICSSGLLTYSY